MQKMPVLFIGHGSPMNAIEDNEFTTGWSAIAAAIPKPKSILCISAHWMSEGTAATGMEKPKTIHDFYGFPDELYSMEYKAAGSKALAARAKGLVKSQKVSIDSEWGLDHGTWSVLVRMYPKADVPVVQLSLNAYLDPKKHFEIGKELSQLRKEGVLILGSGNIVHNLMLMRMQGAPYDWAVEFDKFAKGRLERQDFDSLINYDSEKSSRLAVPTNEHYLPLLYAAGASESEKPRFFNEKMCYASLSMRCVCWGME
jgi:4,5-DOPA dioxygenase extradiol